MEINAKENAENWSKYMETEQDKRIYMPNNGKEVSKEEEKKEAVQQVEIVEEISNTLSGEEVGTATVPVVTTTAPITGSLKLW